MQRETVESRLPRILAMVPWIVERNGASIEEVATRFNLNEEQVAAELLAVQLYEIPPYGPDNMLGIIGDEDGWVGVEAPLFTRARRFSPQEGFGLLAAGKAALGIPGADSDGALASAIEKLENVIGQRAPLAVDLNAPDIFEKLQIATEVKMRLQIDYYSKYRDEISTRVVDPFELVARDGRWYLRAYCLVAKGHRTFRIDRIDNVIETGDTHESVDPGHEAFVPGSDSVIVKIAVSAENAWILEAYPLESVAENNNELIISIAVTGKMFLETLMLRLGSSARLIDDGGYGNVAVEAADRLLSKYLR